MAVKALKTNNPAKWRDLAGKYFKGLRPAMPNESFCHAKLVALRPKDCIGLPVGARNRRFALRKFRFEFSSVGLRRARPSRPADHLFEKSARKKLRESAAKALKSLSGITQCAAFFRGGWCCLHEPSDVQPGLRRQERGVTRGRTSRCMAQTAPRSMGSGPIDSPFSQPPARSRLGPTAISWVGESGQTAVEI
jgi:hypothetical protein